MNRILASTLSLLNGAIALVIILVFVLIGRGRLEPNMVLGTIVGGLLGVIVAGAFCGTIAFLSLIEGHLRTLAEGRRETGRVRLTDETAAPMVARTARTEPTF